MRCRSADRSGLLGEALLAGGICLFPARGHSLVGVGEGGAGGGHTLAAGVDGRAVEPPVVRSGPSWSGANRSDGGPRNAGRCGRRSDVGGGRCWLPIGVMFAAAFGDEATLFRLAGQLEKEAPWAARRPQVWG